MSSKLTGRVVAIVLTLSCFAVFMWMAPIGHAQLPDKTVTPNTADVGINKSFTQQAGAGRGNVMTPDSSLFILKRDPFRAIRRGRQLFQRKYTRLQGMGPLAGDGLGNIETTLAIGAGLVDSCAGCHGRPRARLAPAAMWLQDPTAETRHIFSDWG